MILNFTLVNYIFFARPGLVPGQECLTWSFQGKPGQVVTLFKILYILLNVYLKIIQDNILSWAYTRQDTGQTPQIQDCPGETRTPGNPACNKNN